MIHCKIVVNNNNDGLNFLDYWFYLLLSLLIWISQINFQFVQEYLTRLILGQTVEEAKENKIVDADFLYALVGGIFVAAAAGGAFASGWIAEYLGRYDLLLGF